MPKEPRLDLPEDYDGHADPIDATTRSPQGLGEVVNGLKRLRRITVQIATMDAKRKALQRELVPLMRKPVALLDLDGTPIIATGAQSKPIVVKPEDLLAALIEFGKEPDDAEVIVANVLKPPEIDTKEDGLFVQACQLPEDDPMHIPFEVVAKVAKEKPSSAYIYFPPLRK